MSTANTPLAPAPRGRRRQPQPWLWQIQRLLSSYLPLLLMAFLDRKSTRLNSSH